MGQRTKLLANYITREIIREPTKKIQAKISKEIHKELGPENTILCKKLHFPIANVVEERL